MTTRVEVEDIETTRSEKLLAAVLTAFLLAGLLWVYFHVDVERDHPFHKPAVSAADLRRRRLGVRRLPTAARLRKPGHRAGALPTRPARRQRQDRAGVVRHEARCRIPGAAGRDSKGGSWA